MRYLHNDSFTYSEVKACAGSAAGLCSWCRSFLTLQRLRVWLDEQKAQAFTMKQQRLFAEEEDKRRAAPKKEAGK